MRAYTGRPGIIPAKYQAARVVAIHVNRHAPGISAEALGQAFPQEEIDHAVELRFIYPVVTGGTRYYVGNGGL